MNNGKTTDRLAALLLTTILACATMCSSQSARGQEARYTFSVFGGAPNAAETAFYHPSGLEVDREGNLYVADSLNHRIRKVSAGGVVTTLAGSAALSGSSDGVGAAARFFAPEDVAVDSTGNVYVADTSNHTIRKISPAGVVTTLAGSAGQLGSSDGTGNAARFNSPKAIAIHSNGDLYVTDSVNHTIRRITPAGVVSTFAGAAGRWGWVDGVGSSARFTELWGAAFDGAGNLYVADNWNFTIRRVDPAGVVQTVAGIPWIRGHVDGLRSSAMFTSPCGLAVDNTGTVFIADFNESTIRRISPDGMVSSIGEFNGPLGVAVDEELNLYVADSYNNRLMRGAPLTSTNPAPKIALSTNHIVAVVGAVTPTITATVSASNTPPSNLTVTVTSSDPRVVAESGVCFGTASGSGETREFSIVPIGYGDATLIFKVDDGLLTSWTTLLVTVAPSGRFLFVNSNSVPLMKPGGGVSYISVPLLPFSIGKAAVSLIGLKDAAPASLELGLCGPSGQQVCLLNGAGPAGPVDYAQVTFEDGASGALPATQSLTNHSLAPTQPLNTLAGTTPGGWWFLSVTNGGGAVGSQIAGGWILTLYAAPMIYGPSNVEATVESEVPVHFMVQDADGFVTNLTASIPDNPGLASIVTSISKTNARVVLTGNPNQTGTNRVEVVATDNEGLSETNSFIATFRSAPPAPVSFQIGSAGGPAFSTVLLPVRVARFKDIGTFQFSLHWDPAQADYLGVEQITLPGLSTNSFGHTLASGGTLPVSWDDPDANCQSLADGTALFAVRFLLKGSAATTNQVRIDGIPAALEASHCDLSPVAVQAGSGVLFVTPSIGIGGTVRMQGTATPAPEVSVLVAGPSNGSAQTAANGAYNMPIEVGATYCVTPSKAEDNPTANGVSTLDIALVRRHVLGLVLLDSPYNLLAADVNGSETITTLDIALIRKLILGVTNSFPSGLWRFVPSDYVFAEPHSPWQAPTNRWYTNLVDNITACDFVAIKLGDVNHSWASPSSMAAAEGVSSGAAKMSARRARPGSVLFQANGCAAYRGETVRVPVTVSRFIEVTSAQFTLQWDPAVLRYAEVGDFGVSGLSAANFGAGLAEQGRLIVSWDDPSVSGVTVADGATLFTVNFEVIGQAGSGSPLAFGGSPTVAETSVGLELATIDLRSGWVNVLDARPAISCGREESTGKFVISLPTKDGVRYVLEYNESLSGTPWRALSSGIGDGTVQTFTDPIATNAQRFYRARRE